MHKLRSPLMLLRKLRGISFVALVPQVRPDHILAPVQNRKRHAIADSARFALPWKPAEINGHVIGFVISFPAIIPQVLHYQEFGGEGS
jgi:hypothetical protein